MKRFRSLYTCIGRPAPFLHDCTLRCALCRSHLKQRLLFKVAPAQCPALHTVMQKWRKNPDTSVRGSRCYHAETKSNPACLHRRGAREESGILNIKSPIFFLTPSQELRPFEHGFNQKIGTFMFKNQNDGANFRLDPLEAILVIFGRRALIFFFLKALGKYEKLTPLLCAWAVVINLETQKCRKRAPRSVEFNFFISCDRQKRFSQNERRMGRSTKRCLRF